jgi:ribosomal protein S18 acetylase RimI-like enzyme
MALSIPVTRAGDGLRPIDIGRDLPQIVELLRMVFGDSLEGDDHQLFGDSGSDVFNGWIYRLNPSAARLASGFVWQADGRIVGNATLLSTRAWDRYLVANVAVHPSYRRQGIARALMQSITSTVKTRGGRVILLQVVKDNQSAKDLYLSLGFEYIGDMTTWYATASRLKHLSDDNEGGLPVSIRPLADRRWREAFDLDTAHVHADLNWPEPLQRDAYHRTLWKRAADFMNGRQMETWATMDTQERLSGLATIYNEWGRSHLLTLRVRPDWRGQLERPLLAKAIRRLRYLPRRNVRIDHPEQDEHTGQLLKEANFSIQRTLSHMRLDLSRK